MRLEIGATFPTVEADTVNHGAISLPGDLEHEWNAVLYYRGEW